MNASTTTAAPPLSPKLRWQLSLMMFLQYAIWGAWLPLFYRFVTEYRGLSAVQAGILFAVAAIGAIIAPFLAGQLADRKFATEKFLAFSHIIGACLVWFLASVDTYSGLMVFGFTYALIYTPTLSLTNSLAFHHLPDRDRDFGRVRVWGTVGWIVVGIGIGQYLAQRHNPDHFAANKQLIEAHIEKPDGRERTANKVVVTLKNKETFVGTSVEKSAHAQIFQIEKGTQTILRPVEAGDIAETKPYLDTLIRPEHLEEVKQIVSDATPKTKANADGLTKYSDLHAVVLLGGKPQLDEEVRVTPKEGTAEQGRLLIESNKYVLIRAADKSLKLWETAQVQTVRKVEKEVVGKLDDTGSKWTLKPEKGDSITIDPANVVKKTPYGVFTPEAEAQRISYVNVSGMGDAFRASAILGLILGLYCFMLPHTPPQKGKAPLAFAEAWQEIQKPRLLILFLIAFPVACIHQFYFVHTAGFLGSIRSETGEKIATAINNVFGIGGGGLMTIGQIAEIAVLACMPFLAMRLSRKSLLTLGLLAYTLRFFVFADFPSLEAVLPALALHGVCFGCFFFVCFMIVDEDTTSDVRASAQSLFNLVVVGLGTIFGNLFAGAVGNMATRADGSMDYSILFGVPKWVAVGCLVVLVLFYPSRRAKLATEH